MADDPLTDVPDALVPPELADMQRDQRKELESTRASVDQRLLALQTGYLQPAAEKATTAAKSRTIFFINLQPY